MCLLLLFSLCASTIIYFVYLIDYQPSPYWKRTNVPIDTLLPVCIFRQTPLRCISSTHLKWRPFAFCVRIIPVEPLIKRLSSLLSSEMPSFLFSVSLIHLYASISSLAHGYMIVKMCLQNSLSHRSNRSAESKSCKAREWERRGEERVAEGKGVQKKIIFFSVFVSACLFASANTFLQLFFMPPRMWKIKLWSLIIIFENNI